MTRRVSPGASSMVAATAAAIPSPGAAGGVPVTSSRAPSLTKSAHTSSPRSGSNRSRTVTWQPGFHDGAERERPPPGLVGGVRGTVHHDARQPGLPMRDMLVTATPIRPGPAADDVLEREQQADVQGLVRGVRERPLDDADRQAARVVVARDSAGSIGAPRARAAAGPTRIRTRRTGTGRDTSPRRRAGPTPRTGACPDGWSRGHGPPAPPPVARWRPRTRTPAGSRRCAARVPGAIARSRPDGSGRSTPRRARRAGCRPTVHRRSGAACPPNEAGPAARWATPAAGARHARAGSRRPPPGRWWAGSRCSSAQRSGREAADDVALEEQVDQHHRRASMSTAAASSGQSLP